ncbi:MAG TPA: hypothetical protein VE242_03560 [Chthoniobacterales bacterium]|nr:hypothetical protein [Chthoniobacterales bacterium]
MSEAFSIDQLSRPNFGIACPENGTEPEAGSRKQEAGSKKPEARSKKQEVGSRKQEVVLAMMF